MLKYMVDKTIEIVENIQKDRNHRKSGRFGGKTNRHLVLECST